MIKVYSEITPEFAWNIVNHDCVLDKRDADFIRRFNPTIYHNDAECYIFAFDCKLPSGAWLENIRFSGDMSTATAHIFGQ